MNKSFLNILLVISVIIFIIAVFFYLYFNKKQPEEESIGIKINFIGPNEVNSLENYSYKIEIENDSNKVIESVVLKIGLSDGAFFSEKLQEKDISIFLGSIDPYKSKAENINLFFINAGGIRESIKTIVNYKLLGKDYLFTKGEVFNILVKNPPLKSQIFIPTKIYLGQKFQANFQISNLTNEKLNNVKISIEPPSSFNLISSFPRSENYYWEYNFLEPKEIKNISLIGEIQNLKTSGIFAIKLEFNLKDMSFSLPKDIIKINVLENPVSITIKSTPDNKSVPIGSIVFYEISIKNKSQTILENGFLNVYISDIFDINSVKSDGYLVENENRIYWNSRNKPELLAIKPGDEISFNLSLNLYNSYPIFSNKEKDFIAKIRAEFKTPSIPVEVEYFGNEYLVAAEDEKKIIGNIIVEQSLSYNDPDLPGAGPFPPQPNKPTLLTWRLKIKTIGEDFNDFVITTKLPLEVNLTNKVAGDVILDNLKFDSKTGNFIYSIKKLPANLGYSKNDLELAFQLAVEIPANVEIRSFTIIPPVQYLAVGAFSGSSIKNSLREITVAHLLY